MKNPFRRGEQDKKEKDSEARKIDIKDIEEAEIINPVDYDYVISDEELQDMESDINIDLGEDEPIQYPNQEFHLELLEYFKQLGKYRTFPMESYQDHALHLSDIEEIVTLAEKKELDLSYFIDLETEAPKEKFRKIIYERHFGDSQFGVNYVADQFYTIRILPVSTKLLGQAILRKFPKRKPKKFVNAALVTIYFSFDSSHISVDISPYLFDLMKETTNDDTLSPSIYNLFFKYKGMKDWKRKLSIENKHSLSVTDEFLADMDILVTYFKRVLFLSDLYSKFFFSLISPEFRYLFELAADHNYQRYIHQNQSEFSKDFYSEDIEDIQKAVSFGQIGRGLIDFLDVPGWGSRGRVDLLSESSLEFYKETLIKTPVTRWPKPYEETLMQKLAINLIFKNASENPLGSIISLNGPPGTGKTTTLKDVIANVLLYKVNYMSSESFKVEKRELPSKIGYFDFGTELRKYSIMVASSNNEAVFNITKELPSDPYLLEKSFAFFGRDFNQSHWGMISGALGNRANKEDFFERLMPLMEGGNLLMPDLEGFKIDDFVNQFRSNLKKSKLTKLQFSPTSLKDNQWQKSDKNLYNYTSEGGEEMLTNYDRERLFDYTMKLYMALIDKYKHHLKTNLQLARDYLMNKKAFEKKLINASKSERENVVRVIFDTLFLLIPVQSSTFASIKSYIGDLKANSIGYSLIDEAGQSNPEAAIGLIYRTNHTIVLGDPYQVEPIPNQDTDTTEKFFKVKYLPNLKDNKMLKGNVEWSVQFFADQASKYGGYDHLGNWIGIALLVHRRCQYPAFLISNYTTYGQRMVFGTPQAKYKTSLRSQWIDNKDLPQTEKSNYIPSQGEKAIQLGIQYYTELKSKEAVTIFVISPFKAVAIGIRRKLLDYDIPSNLRFEVGTIHTFQGKECDFTILVLGGSNQNLGAIRWATQKPNILNVAVSRSKGLLIVIGDKDLWTKSKNFNICWKVLEKEKRGLGKIPDADEGENR